MKFFLVGGAVRDSLMGIPSKDLDFAVEAPGFDALVAHLKDEGFTIHQERPDFGTVRAGIPEGHALREHARDADFVLCRKDGPSSDGRRPDFVEPGTLADDLARRDFTVNAIAQDPETGDLIDPHGGVLDVQRRRLEFVGNPFDRIREDGLRVMRGFRFMVMKGLEPSGESWTALVSPEAAEALGADAVAIERIQGELDRMVKLNTRKTLEVLGSLPTFTLDAIFRDGLRFAATLAS